MVSIKFNVDKSNLQMEQKDNLTTLNLNQYECDFTFSKEWDNLAKVVIFSNKDVSIKQQIVDGKCTIPWEVLELSGTLKICVYGLEGNATRFTTNILGVEVASALGVRLYEDEKTLEFWEKSLILMNDFAEDTAENAKLAKEHKDITVEKYNSVVSLKNQMDDRINSFWDTYSLYINDFVDLADSKTTAFNQNANTKINGFTDTCSLYMDDFIDLSELKTDKFNQNVNDKIDVFNENSENITGIFDDHMEQNINMFNDNVENKIEHFNDFFVDAKSVIGEKVELVEEYVEDVNNSIVDYVGNKTDLQTKDKTSLVSAINENNALALDNHSELTTARKDFNGNDHDTVAERLQADMGLILERFNKADLVPYNADFINASQSYLGTTQNTVIKGVTVQSEDTISSVKGDITIKSVQKNICNYVLNVNQTTSSADWVSLDGIVSFWSAVKYAQSDVKIKLFAGTYTASANFINCQSVQLVDVNDGSIITPVFTESGTTITIATNTIATIRCKVTDTSQPYYIDNLQIEVGSVATEYEEYKESSVTYEDVALRQIQTGTDTIEGNKLIQRVGEIRLTSESINDSNLRLAPFGETFDDSVLFEVVRTYTNDYAYGLANHIPANRNVSTSNVNGFYFLNNSLRFRIVGITTMDELIEFLTETPITILYKLSDPIVTELDTQELITYDNVTNIFSVGSDVVPIISTKVPSDIPAVIAELSSTVSSQNAQIDTLTNELSSVQSQPQFMI